MGGRGADPKASGKPNPNDAQNERVEKLCLKVGTITFYPARIGDMTHYGKGPDTFVLPGPALHPVRAGRSHVEIPDPRFVNRSWIARYAHARGLKVEYKTEWLWK